MFQSIDNFYQDLKTRIELVQKIYKKFAAIQLSHLIETEIVELSKLISNLTQTLMMR